MANKPTMLTRLHDALLAKEETGRGRLVPGGAQKQIHKHRGTRLLAGVLQNQVHPTPCNDAITCCCQTKTECQSKGTAGLQALQWPCPANPRLRVWQDFRLMLQVATRRCLVAREDRPKKSQPFGNPYAPRRAQPGGVKCA